MTRDLYRRPAVALTVAAAVVIVILTAAAFWLSYAHLHTVAAQHGLGGSVARAWAWPATLDLFIVAGELLMLRASLARTTDWWAIGLTVVGSGGSIALNVLGVEGGDPLSYVTAAVPPTAALLAFGALMRQVHTVLARPEVEVPAPVHLPADPDPVYVPAYSAVPVEVVPTPVPEVEVHTEVPSFEPEVNTPALVHTEPEVEVLEVDAPEPAAPARLTGEEARAAIEAGWQQGRSVRETAVLATRSPAYVQKVFAALEETNGPRPVPGQLALAG